MSETKMAVDAIASMLGLGSGQVWHQMQVENMYDLSVAKKAIDLQTEKIKNAEKKED